MTDSKKREKVLQDIAKFRLFDDTFMSAAFDGQIQETENLLRIVLEKEDICVISSKSQYYISNILGKEARLDIFAKDSCGQAYHVEVQRDIKGASVQRARFTGALVDAQLLKKGQKHIDIPDRYTIFITEDDVFGKGLPAYHAENTIKELDGKPLGDGSHIIYINGKYRNVETPIGKLMHDFFCVESKDIINPLLRERVKFLKETEGGKEYMCEIMENRITEEKIELAKKAIARGKHSLEEIAEDFELPLAFVQELSRKVLVTV
jgi:hypothetical protein